MSKFEYEGKVYDLAIQTEKEKKINVCGGVLFLIDL